MNATILYLSSNQEDPAFEKKIQETLLKNSGGLPIISITQKPANLGTNICVGEVGASGFNFCRQVQIGVEAIKTKFVIHAESDCLYPPDYFQYEPAREDIAYRNKNIYVLKYKQGFYKKSSSTFAQIFGRDAYLKRLNFLFKNYPQKWSMELKNFPKESGQPFLEQFETFETKNPCLSFKTGRGMRLQTVTEKEEFQEIPYWGTVENVRKHYETN